MPTYPYNDATNSDNTAGIYDKSTIIDYGPHHNRTGNNNEPTGTDDDKYAFRVNDYLGKFHDKLHGAAGVHHYHCRDNIIVVTDGTGDDYITVGDDNYGPRNHDH